MGNFHSTQNQLAPGDQRVNVVPYANMDHERRIELRFRRTKEFPLRLALLQMWRPA
jgi:hypothetical protein